MSYITIPNIVWSENNYSALGQLEQELCDLIDDYFLEQLCLTPTRLDNILDLIITNTPDLVTITDTCDPSKFAMTSDHRLIFYSILVAHKALTYDQKGKI